MKIPLMLTATTTLKPNFRTLCRA